MGRSQEDAGRRGGSHGRALGWLSRNRDEILRGVFIGLLVAGIVAVLVGVAGLAGSRIAAWVLVPVAAAAVVAGRLIGRRGRQPPSRPPQPPNARELKKLSAYVESIAAICHRMQLGELEDAERELLIVPARLLEQQTGGSVQLAAFVPAEDETDEASWSLPCGAGISRSECREFEVPVRDSFLARMQSRWGPSEKVVVIKDLQAQGSRKAGADLEAFARAGFQMLRCFPFGFATEADRPRACIVLLSREPGDFSGFDDLYLVLLSFLLSARTLADSQTRLDAEEGTSE